MDRSQILERSGIYVDGTPQGSSSQSMAPSSHRGHPRPVHMLHCELTGIGGALLLRLRDGASSLEIRGICSSSTGPHQCDISALVLMWEQCIIGNPCHRH